MFIFGIYILSSNDSKNEKKKIFIIIINEKKLRAVKSSNIKFNFNFEEKEKKLCKIKRINSISTDNKMTKRKPKSISTL